MNKKPAWNLGNSKTVAGLIRRALNCLLVFQILSVGLPKLFLRCKLLDLTESEKDRGISVHILFNY